MKYLRLTCYGKRLFSSMVENPAADSSEYLHKLRESYRFEEHKQIVVPIFKKALLYGHKTAIKDQAGEYSYFQLYANSKRLSRQISNICGSGSCSTVGFFFVNNVMPILYMWSCWMSGQLVLPLRTNYSLSSLQRMVRESKVKLLITPKAYMKLGRLLARSQEIALLTVDHAFIETHEMDFNFSREIFMADNLVFFEGILQNNFYTQAPAMQLYFDEPDKEWRKIYLTHKQVNAQMKTLVQTWSISAEDRLLTILPSQQLNSYIDTTHLSLAVGSSLQIHDPSDVLTTWATLLGLRIPLKERINVVIAEPTVYLDLLRAYDKIFAKNRRMVEYIKYYCSKKIRLMISCSDKVPPETYARWLDITGHSLLQSLDVAETEILKMAKATTMEKPQSDHPTGNTIWKFLASGENNRVRIVDSQNRILLQFEGMSRKQIHTTAIPVIGSLWISSAAKSEEAFLCTGEIVAYQEGNFTTIGRCNIGN